MSSEWKIILHVGLPKTGTSTVQNVFHANRDFLLEQEGILYPSLAPNLSTPLLTIFKNDPQNQADNKTGGFTSEKIAERQKSYLDSLNAEISSRDWDTLLLSAEGLSNLRESEMAKLREWGEQYSSQWLVLACVRHPVDWTRSVVQQCLKQGDTLQGLYEDPPATKYCQRVSNAMSVFGRENVRVFDLESAARSEGGIVGAFAVQTGLSAPSREYLASRTVNANESPSLEAVRVHDALNRQRPMFVENGRNFRRPGPGHELPYLKRIEGRKFDMPDSVKEKVRARSREDVAWLNETFGLDLYRDITDFESGAEAHEEPVEALSDPAIESIAEILGELLTENVFRRTLEGGEKALANGNTERAEKMLRKAIRLDPEAIRPKELLEEVTVKQIGESANIRRNQPDRNSESRKSDSERRLLRWPPPQVKDMLVRLEKKTKSLLWKK